MKKYMICLFLFLIISAACLTTGYVVTRKSYQETVEGIPATELETETVQEDRIVSNQEQVRHESVTEKYYLVSEGGFLLVFKAEQEDGKEHSDSASICLYTHIPLMDFPETEQHRLREGIWFHSMIEVYNYLESYTS